MSSSVYFVKFASVRDKIDRLVYRYNTIQYKICKAPCCRGFRGAGEQEDAGEQENEQTNANFFIRRVSEILGN